MSQFSPEDFQDSIDDMCDDALRRMYAFQEGGLDCMLIGDHYRSEIIKRDMTLEVVEFDTHTRAGIVDNIHHDVLDHGVPEYVNNILSGAMIALARHAAYRGRGSDIMIPNHDMARSYTSERLLLNGHVVKERKPVKILTYELGSLGTSSLVLGPRDDTWDLYYDAHYRGVLIRY